MGSSDSGGAGAGYSGVGSIVWVRRRNGSWWPGKILGSEELSASHVMSPRSGTPVKLLGREDASVDWYNLEKSKRVKAFRCGDFDDCIEKAEASLGAPIKKREKYARREDAILHALELEKQLVDQKNHEFREGNWRSESSKENKYSSIPESIDRGDENLNLEYDSLKNNPRKSALMDYGHRKASSKQMNSLYLASNGVHKAAVDPSALAFPDGSPFIGRYDDVDSQRSINKKKRPPKSSLEEPITKRRDRRRRLAQVLESSEQYDHSLQPDSDIYSLRGGEHTGHDFHITRREPSSRSSEETESDSSGTGSVGREMNSELTTYSDASVSARVLSQNRLAFQGQQESTSSDERDASVPDEFFHDPASPSMEIYKWQLKGKRNIRQLPRRSIDSSMHGMYPEGIRRSLNRRMLGPDLSYYHDSDDFNNEVDLIENGSRSLDRLGNERYLSNLQAASRRQSVPRRQLSDWEEITVGDGSSKGYLDGRADYVNPSYMARSLHDTLVDVNVKVEAKHTRGEHVPWVSLMSKLNGRAIIGHPIQIETLEDAATDILLGASSGTLVYDDRNKKVPRSHLSALLDSDEADNHYIDQDSTSQFKKPVDVPKKKSSVKKALSHVPKPPQQRAKKQNKKASLFANRKTRTLSSMGIHQMDRGNHYMDGVIKPLASGPPTVACIPVKLVFSRLLEAVGRPPSGSTAHGHSVSNKERTAS
ncbi:hypothetical protein AKJ16_DCAP12465 [Drosera capensis]